MDHLMAENITKIIKTVKWGKSHQKNIKKNMDLVIRKNTGLTSIFCICKSQIIFVTSYLS